MFLVGLTWQTTNRWH